MPIAYSAALDRITVTGFLVGVPCTFLDVYNADKAGTYSLHARVGVAAADGGPVAVDNAERPADYVILGGASDDLYITVANWANMTAATIRVTGTDRDSAAQTDDVVVNANGNFSTAKWFKTITHTQITVFTKSDAGSFDYDLTQGQWGRVWKQGDRQFMFECRLHIGDALVNTWFTDTDQQVLWHQAALQHDDELFVIQALATVTFGELVDLGYKITKNGVAFLMDESTWRNCRFRVYDNSTAYFYSCTLYAADNRLDCEGYYDRLWNVITNALFENITNADIYNLIQLQHFSNPVNTTFENVFSLYGGGHEALYASVGATLTDWFVRAPVGGGDWLITMAGNPADVYLVNTDSLGGFLEWRVWWTGAHTKAVIRQYHFDLRVVDNTGIGIVSVTVAMADVNGTGLFSVATDANGDIAQQTITYKTYERAAAGNGPTDTETTFSPHTVTISKPGYAPRTIKYTMDRAREEIEKLGGAAPHGMEYRRRRVPGEVSAMMEEQ